MERLAIAPRPHWIAEVERQGLIFHSSTGPYWNEGVCYRFTAAEIDGLETATNELHQLCLQAVEHIFARDLLARFEVPPAFHAFIRASWERREPSLYGRFDLAYDGTQPPKLYEYNADTPTSLLEAAVIQWSWLEQRLPAADQFNSIHEKLIARWAALGLTTPVHFGCLPESDEDLATCTYLQDTALQAGLTTHPLAMREIGWEGERFVDLEMRPIRTLFKLYPWEWLLRESFGPHLRRLPLRLIEPPWKMLLSHKAILPLLWELFPGHPNLLPAFHAPEPLGAQYVRKPALGREGANVTLHAAGQTFESGGDYGAGSFVYQALHLPARFGGEFAVIGSWIIGEEAAGIGVRESGSPITKNTSRFVPHYFE